MCEASPGLRCSTDTCHVAETTSRAYYEMFGPDAPPIDPLSSASEVTASSLDDERTDMLYKYRSEAAQLRRQNPDATAVEVQHIMQVWRAQRIIDAGGSNPLPDPEPVKLGAGGRLAEDAELRFIPGSGWQTSARFVVGGLEENHQETASTDTATFATREQAEEYLSRLTPYGPGDPGPHPEWHNVAGYPHRDELGREVQRLRDRASESRALEAYHDKQVRAIRAKDDAPGYNEEASRLMQARGVAAGVASTLEARADALDTRRQAWEQHILTLGIAHPSVAWRRSAELRGRIDRELDPFKKDALIAEHNVLVPAIDRLAHVVPAPDGY